MPVKLKEKLLPKIKSLPKKTAYVLDAQMI